MGKFGEFGSLLLHRLAELCGAGQVAAVATLCGQRSAYVPNVVGCPLLRHFDRLTLFYHSAREIVQVADFSLFNTVVERASDGVRPFVRTGVVIVFAWHHGGLHDCRHPLPRYELVDECHVSSRKHVDTPLPVTSTMLGKPLDSFSQTVRLPSQLLLFMHMQRATVWTSLPCHSSIHHVETAS